MARIQILPLPTQKVGDTEHTPFVIILDQFAPDEAWEPEYSEDLKHSTGAQEVIGYRGTLDAPGHLTLTDEEQQTLVSYLTTPHRWTMGQTAMTVERAAAAITEANSRTTARPDDLRLNHEQPHAPHST